MSEAVGVLRQAMDMLLDEEPGGLPGPVALERLRTVLACAERLRAVQLLAVRDLDVRELYALDAAGSARGWLRRQPGGEDGQVTLARRLGQRPTVSAALADARIGLRTATQLCAALDSVPADLDDALVAAVAQDGIGRILLEQTGGTPEDETAAAAVVAQRAADEAVLATCRAATSSPPAARLEPPLVLLAERLSPGQLGSALRLLLDALQPDAGDLPARDPYYLELRILADGDVDVRGLLDPETGQSLAVEIERRLQAARAAAAKGRGARAAEGTAGAGGGANEDLDPDSPTGDTAGERFDTDGPDGPDLGDDEVDDPLSTWDHALANADARAARRAAQAHGDLGNADHGPDAPLRLVSIGRRRHDALRDVLADAAASDRPGEPRPCHLTVIATLDAVHGRPGALPGVLTTTDGRSVPLRTETLQRLGCHSRLDAVLLDAHGTPVGASSTRRMPDGRERRALRARWGPHCAVAGCHRTRTVPHHVVPWWLSGRTRLRDLVPLCTTCHHDLHDGHRTLRLRDGRLVDDRGWATAVGAAA